MKRQYGNDNKEWLQVRIPSWLKAKMLDTLQAGTMSDFVRQAIEEKFTREDAATGSYAEYKYRYPDREVVK